MSGLCALHSVVHQLRHNEVPLSSWLWDSVASKTPQRNTQLISNMHRQDRNDLFRCERTKRFSGQKHSSVFVCSRDTPHAAGFGVPVDSVGVYTTITRTGFWSLPTHHLGDAHAFTTATPSRAWNCHVKAGEERERERECDINGVKWKVCECLGPTSLAALLSAAKSTF